MGTICSPNTVPEVTTGATRTQVEAAPSGPKDSHMKIGHSLVADPEWKCLQSPTAPTTSTVLVHFNSWTDGFILNYGWLVNLADLNTETDYVRQRIADYFTTLLAMGFSGFRIDAAKHISPTNLAAIFAKLKANLGGSLPNDFITYL